MRSRLVLLILTLMSTGAIAQREGKFEVAMGIGTDIIRISTLFKNDHNHSASICYNPANEWGVALYFGQQVYSLDRLTSENQSFLGGRTPEVSKTVTSLLIGIRNFIPSKSEVLNPYGSVALGYAKSVSSTDGYYVFRGMSNDTMFYRVQSGQFFLGLLSLGIQVRPLTFFDLFAELQTWVPLNVDLFSGLIAYRVGVGVTF